MQLTCNSCQHAFESAFGPPVAKCPRCGQGDVRHAGSPQWHAPPELFAPQGQDPFRFHSEPFPPLAARDSVPPHVLNNLPWLAASVALAVFCQPVGIAGIYFADQAKTLARWGRIEEAQEKLRYAQIAVVGGFAFVIIVGFIIIVVAAVG